jgi:uncharacterized BrkB/YihY/UPF0761 family membrane protein
VGSYFLDRRQVFDTVTQFIQEALPISKQAINENLLQVLEERGTAGIFSLLILLWSASGCSPAKLITSIWRGLFDELSYRIV